MLELVTKSFKYSATAVFVVTTSVWIFGVTNHLFLATEIPQYIVIFLLPAACVCISCWLMFSQPVLWRRIVGVAMLLPSLVIWGISLILVFHGFRIH